MVLQQMHRQHKHLEFDSGRKMDGKCEACGKSVTEAESLIVFHVERNESEIIKVLQYHEVYGQQLVHYTCEPAIKNSYTVNGVHIDVFSVQGYTLEVLESFQRFYRLKKFSEEATKQKEAICRGYYQAKAHELPELIHLCQAQFDGNYPAKVRSAVTMFSNAFEKRKDYAACYGKIAHISLVRVYKNTIEKCVMLHYNDTRKRFSREVPSICMKYTYEQDLTFLTILKELCSSKTRDMVETARFLNELLDKITDPLSALQRMRCAIDTGAGLDVKADFEVVKSTLANLITIPGVPERKSTKLW